ncbi:type 1 glutamine amidotransferase domain-containing protein [Pseudomonas gingeri]|uniref:type 1 glutamine amidotransferase domain-containing protein n=1 Tax=Pseudomonas gingeri TaxID=117681 RepID=UPI0015A0A0CD|nr:type 1 glutamine amidotransferase domain-containing protein [Pseudomonas gingeri]NWD72797.1 type 1 glutamine amidotransferase domain-containing protein [Pseudomonas gingeri]
MKLLKMGGALLALGLAISNAYAAEPSKGKVLVVMSSAKVLDLKDGKKYETGYYLNELATPLKAIVDAGYTPVFADPTGNEPQMDASSNADIFFAGDAAKRNEALRFVAGFDGLKHPMKLSSVAAKGTVQFKGLFMPGGHAPMQDLMKDKDLGKILTQFHTSGRPTGIICHGPIALLAALPDPVAFDKALIAGDEKAVKSLAKGWPYAGYKLTVFSADEEKQLEPTQLKGSVLFYNDAALAKAGATVDNAAAWQPHVVVDRELITGQQPFSDHAFADALVSQLNTAHP